MAYAPVFYRLREGVTENDPIGMYTYKCIVLTKKLCIYCHIILQDFGSH